MNNVTLFVAGGIPLDGVLIYSVSEYSFRFDVGSPIDAADRVGDSGQASLLIGTLQVEVGVATGHALFAWGLHPKARWQEGAVVPDRVTPGAVIVSNDRGLQAGVAIQIAEVGAWGTTYDPGSGWLRITADPGVPDDVQVYIASATALGLRGDQLNSVWLQPIFE